jgi:hypothetical protein
MFTLFMEQNIYVNLRNNIELHDLVTRLHEIFKLPKSRQKNMLCEDLNVKPSF